MAGRSRLNGRRGRLLALLAVVLLLHAVALQWLSHQLQQSAALRPLATPMFTRLLQQQAPAVIPVSQVVAPQRARPRGALVAAAKPPPSKPARAASEPSEAQAAPPREEPAQPAPAPEYIAAAAPDVGASAAAPPASAASAAPVAPVAPEAATAAPAAATAASGPVAATGTALDSWPADTRLNYRLGGYFRSGELHGSARVQWQRQGERYETRIEIDVTLLAELVLTSQGEVTAQGLFPRAYEELRRSGPRGARLGDASIVLNDGRTLPRPQGVQDTASQFVELSHRFATGQDVLAVGRSVSVWLARPGGVDLWTYDVVERETLHSEQLGPIDAFHLKPRLIANPRGNITAEMWFAPSLQYLPVRIRVGMGGATYVDLMVEKIEQR